MAMERSLRTFGTAGGLDFAEGAPQPMALAEDLVAPEISMQTSDQQEYANLPERPQLTQRQLPNMPLAQQGYSAFSK